MSLLKTICSHKFIHVGVTIFMTSIFNTYEHFLSWIACLKHWYTTQGRPRVVQRKGNTFHRVDRAPGGTPQSSILGGSAPRRGPTPYPLV